MPLGGQGRHVIFHYGPAAPAALGREHVEVIVLAIGTALPLVEPFLAELFAALGAEKVFRVPRLFQSGHAFLKRNEFITGGSSLYTTVGWVSLTSNMGPLQ